MERIWRRFFNCQRNALQLAVRNGKTTVFDEVAAVFSEEYGLAAVRWDVAMGDDEWTTICSWERDQSGMAGDRVTSQEVGFGESLRKHRFTLHLLPNAKTLPSKIALAMCSTLQTATELHDEHEMYVADARSDGDDELGHATVDAEGHVLHANERFVTLLRRSQPDWDAQTLPMPIDQSPATLRHGMTWKGLFFYVEPGTPYIRLRARPDRRLPNLSPRELEVARLIASGMTFKEVSRRLDMAPSTASTHLYKVYDKLGINRRSALVEWLNENSDSLNSSGK
ncbi:helix-turn-helix transcriptional regulator [uncultured Abyssibacter sp.]|uniref:response regulator transcription factor n=1 Tax=uncultured Abyssibacter sp. TaxID=2320202 RepID=UPI0032B13025